MRQIGYPETPVTNYQSKLRNSPEKLTSKVLCYFVLHLLNTVQTIHPLP
jgi:hypothetical protein